MIALVTLVVGLTGAASAQEPVPGIIAQASAQPPTGVMVVWTVVPGIEAESFEVSRSRAGSPFTVVGNVSAAASAFTDSGGQTSDIYVVAAMINGSATFTSNPAPALPGETTCPWITLLDDFPYVEIHPECINIPPAALVTTVPAVVPELIKGHTNFPVPAWFQP